MNTSKPLSEVLVINPVSGDGNNSVQIYSKEWNYGRSMKRAFVDVSLRYKPVTRTINISQNGESEFIVIDEEVFVPYTGGMVTIKGRSNSAALLFELTENPVYLILPQYYLLNNEEVKNGSVIEGDPGLYDAFDFEITFDNILENVTSISKESILKVTTYEGNEAYCSIIQEESERLLKVDKEEIKIAANGIGESFILESKSEWEIEASEWNDGTPADITLSQSNGGIGSFTISVDGTQNEYIDKHLVLNITTVNDFSVQVLVTHLGLREEFSALDDEFILADNEIFTVLKE